MFSQIVSRLEGVEEKLRHRGINFIPLTTIEEIVSILNEKGLIDGNILESVLKHRLNSEIN